MAERLRGIKLLRNQWRCLRLGPTSVTLTSLRWQLCPQHVRQKLSQANGAQQAGQNGCDSIRVTWRYKHRAGKTVQWASFVQMRQEDAWSLLARQPSLLASRRPSERSCLTNQDGQLLRTAIQGWPTSALHTNIHCTQRKRNRHRKRVGKGRRQARASRYGGTPASQYLLTGRLTCKTIPATASAAQTRHAGERSRRSANHQGTVLI